MCCNYYIWDSCKVILLDFYEGAITLREYYYEWAYTLGLLVL